MKKTSVVALLSVGLGACSLSGQDRVEVNLSIGGFSNRGTASLLELGDANLVPDRTTAFDCIGFNVMGDGIEPIRNFDEGESGSVSSRLKDLISAPEGAFCSTYPGVTTLPILTSELTTGTTITRNLSVPIGGNRIFQAIGILKNGNSKVCGSTRPIGEVDDDDGAEYYELGRAYVPFLGASTSQVSIPNAYVGATEAKRQARLLNCEHSAGAPAALAMTLPSSIRGDVCNQVGGYFKTAAGVATQVSQTTTVTVTASGITGRFYADSACTQALGNAGEPLVAHQNAGTNSFRYWFKPTLGGTNATFTASSAGLTSGTATVPYVFSSCTPASIHDQTIDFDTTNLYLGQAIGQKFELTDAISLKSFSLKASLTGITPAATGTLSIHRDDGAVPSSSSAPLAAAYSGTTCTGVNVVEAGSVLTCNLSSAVTLDAGSYWIRFMVDSLTGSSSPSVVIKGCDNASCVPLNFAEAKLLDGNVWSNAEWPSSIPGNAYFDVSGCYY